MADIRKTKAGAAKRQARKDEGSLTEAIAKKAYEIYEERGREQGKDLDHWLEAEKMVRAGKKKSR